MPTSVRLRWCEAEKAHRQALEAFICTDPPKRIYDRLRGQHHPREWEYDIQRYIHGLRFHVPARLPKRVLLGFDASGRLCAVIAYKLYEQLRVVLVQAIACSHDARGNGYAGEAYEAMFEDLEKLGWTDGFEVEGNADPRNTASKAAFARVGGRFVQMEGAYEIWRLTR